jgi:hypothetical protein
LRCAGATTSPGRGRVGDAAPAVGTDSGRYPRRGPPEARSRGNPVQLRRRPVPDPNPRSSRDAGPPPGPGRPGRRRREPFHATGYAPRVSDAPLVLGIESSCDETGVGLVRGHTLLADAVGQLGRRNTPASVGWSRRWPAGPTWSPWCPRWTGPWPRPASAGRRSTPWAVTSGPGWPGR